MIRVLYFDWFSAGTEFYRLMPLDYIDHLSLKITRSSDTNPSFALLNSFDVIIIERPSSHAALGIIKTAKDMGKYVISDWDDDSLHIDQYNPMYGVYEHERPAVIEGIVLSNEVWVSTVAIKESYKLFNKNIHIIPNAHNNYLFPQQHKRPFSANKIATWRGGHSHEGDMYDLNVPETVVSVVNDNQDWTFNFHGQRFLYLEKRCGKNYFAFGGASTIQFHKLMHKQNACLFFYPLATTLFNKSKSNCAFLEATYCGSAYFGNTKLPELAKLGDCIYDFSQLPNKIGDMEGDGRNSLAWEYIQDTLLLSEINELRTERLLTI